MSGKRASVLDMEFPVEVWLASQDLPLGRLLDLRPGDEVPLPAHAEERVDLVANGITLASGELVVVDGKFGVRVTSTPQQQLARPTSDGESSPAEAAEPEPVPEQEQTQEAQKEEPA